MIIWLAYFVAFLIGRHCVPIVIHCPVSFAGLDIGGADKTNAGLMRKGVYKLVHLSTTWILLQFGYDIPTHASPKQKLTRILEK